MVHWAYYPKSRKINSLAELVVNAFKKAEKEIDSAAHKLPSNDVLARVNRSLRDAGFKVEDGMKRKVAVPVLFGQDGKLEKAFCADAYHELEGFVVEVEAGRGVTNYQFLKDLFEACMMHGVKYLAIAVRNNYRGSKNFDEVCKFFDAVYASNRLQLPLDGILIIGY